MDHWRTFTDAIKLWWEHKYLWLIGIIGVILSVGGSSTNSLNVGNGIGSDQYQGVLNTIQTIPVVVWVIIGICFLIFGIIWSLLAMYLQARAQASLIKATAEIGQGKELTFGTSWALGKPYYWTLFKQQLLIALPGFLLGLFVAVLVIVLLSVGKNFTPNTLSQIWLLLMLLICPILVIIICYAVISGIAYTFGSRISIFEKKGAIAGLNAGLKFFINNIGDILISWLLTWLVSLATTPIYLVLGLAAGILLLVTIIAVIAVMIANFVVGLILAILLGILFNVLGAFLSGPVSAFTNIFWTKVYLALSKRG